MDAKRQKPEEIVSKLRQIDVAVGQYHRPKPRKNRRAKPPG
jgi:hypothetical protein